jgi:diadenosine tetraphosphate (Ap4A) HIT family hydrolase
MACIADAMSATFLTKMLAQQLAGERIEQAHIHRVPLHIDLAPEPAWRRSVVAPSGFSPDQRTSRVLRMQ